VKRTFSLQDAASAGLVIAGATLIAATYGLVRLSYGLLLPDVQRELGFGPAVAGGVSAGASILYCAGAAAGLVLSGRHARALIVASGVTAGAGAAGMAAAGDVGAFATWAVIASTGAGLASPALVAIVQRNLAPQRSEQAQSIVNAGTGPGLVAAGLLALALLPHWRPSWFAAAAVTVIAAALVLAFDRRATDPAPDAAAPPPSLPPRSWFRSHVRLIAAAFLMGAGSAAVWVYGRSLLVEAGAASVVSVVAWVVLGAGGAAVVATVRPLARLSPRTCWAVTTGVVAIATAALPAAAAALPIAMTACLAFGWSYTAGSGALIAWTAEIDAARAATGTALLFIVLVLGQGVGSAALGAAVAAMGYPSAFLVAAAAAAGAALLGVGRPPRR
jgi:predicted MFS family arabinose efflux permease